ncbi:FAD-dependent oxidoreductase [Nocardia flavorosea]|uniref:FAD-dependent oxidoreductase n=1 Tax=Nocardia flavorosea TaxID=53429 RepID=A0A846YJ18_9NOCA|nr:FAD-dependent oxidoreductase [Nocardia flavorosea]NKY57811.1 FAD-dependent oxidoreductase [Nocardia flavorosea]
MAADGREWSADVVVTAVGMEPDDVLAERAGLDVHDGILVDEFAAASAPGVYAAGDVARFPDRILGGTVRIEHWNHAQAHGAAARSILGIREPYAEVPWCRTTQFGRNLQIAGYPSAGTETIVHGDLADGALLALVLDGDRLVGAAGTGRPRELCAAKILIKDGPYVPSAALQDGTADLVALAADAARYAAPPTVAGR